MESRSWAFLKDVWGSLGTNVFAVGGSTILHYDGLIWSSMKSGTGITLNGIWGSSGTDVFAVGDSGVILHYDGLLPTTTTTVNGITTTTIANGGLCSSEFIYGKYSVKTEILKHFRDNILNQSQAGQEIIRLYYQWSPAIVKVMEEDEEFKEEVKELFDGFLELIEKE